MIHRHREGEPCNTSCTEGTATSNPDAPLVTMITDLGHAAVSLGNHALRTPVAHVVDWASRCHFAERECLRLAAEFRRAGDEALDLARRFES